MKNRNAVLGGRREGRDVEVGRNLAKNAASDYLLGNFLERAWSYNPPSSAILYIYIYRFPLTFAQHLCVDLVKRIRYGEDEMNKGWLEKIFERSEPKMETFKKG